ncbi:ROK family protein [Alicyclobacillus mengziensis]|uniref:ROK family protein n=1 Tax=Alicyclobacillus mengziensis TaxID=2931921 RepID=A0A9X7Z5S8_9BACL|nr:ROK family protein [Alicyclobacillus mengziensis]QSO47194.1 ROK family protein [Alicyclobacillus mengziensis]
MHAIDPTAMRRMNRASVFRKVFEADTISRIQISKDLDMNKATVSSIVDDLIKEQFVTETGYGASQGGRKPVLLEFNRTAAYVISIDVQITHATTAVLSLKGDIIWLREQPLYGADEQPTKENLVIKLEREIQIALGQVPNSPHGVLGVGIALPGMVNAERGYVHYLPNLEIFDWPMGKELEKRVQLPVFIDNDANCGALAEHIRTGKGNMVFVNAGIGIGAGIIANGQLYRGHNGIAGEYGHMTISAMGLRCSCGSYGCWEEYASERGLLRILQDHGEERNTKLPNAAFTSHCIEKATHGDDTYTRAFAELGESLGVGIANIGNTLNPERICLGGSIAGAYPFVISRIEQAMNQRSVSRNKRIRIDVATHDSVVRGAARLVVQHVLFSPEGTW